MQLYPVLVQDRGNTALITNICHSYGLHAQGRRGKFLWTKYNGVDECIAAIERTYPIDELKASTLKYNRQHKKDGNDTRALTMTMFMDDDFNDWMKCVNDLDYNLVKQHYCKDEIVHY